MLRIPRTEHVSSDGVLEKIQTKRLLILNIRKKQMKFLEHILGKVGLKTLILTGQFEVKSDRGKSM